MWHSRVNARDFAVKPKGMRPSIVAVRLGILMAYGE
jgi:hypothetical protein